MIQIEESWEREEREKSKIAIVNLWGHAISFYALSLIYGLLSPTKKIIEKKCSNSCRGYNSFMETEIAKKIYNLFCHKFPSSVSLQ